MKKQLIVKLSCLLMFLFFAYSNCLFADENAVATETASLEDVMPQYSSDGNFECTIKRLYSRKGVITLQASIKNISSEKRKLKFDYKSVYLIDITANKKYHPLRDEKDRIIAGPRDCYDHNEGDISRSIEANGQVIIWVKFPATGAQTVGVFIPGFIPFDEVPILR